MLEAEICKMFFSVQSSHVLHWITTEITVETIFFFICEDVKNVWLIKMYLTNQMRTTRQRNADVKTLCGLKNEINTYINVKMG